MKKVLILTLAISLVVAGIALAGVISSKHDVRQSAWGGTAKTSINTTQVCVFCHHPHRGSANTNSALLWNINDAVKSYAVYNGASGGTSSTMNATGNNSGALNTTTAAAYSLLCMGCHDGSATNTLIRGSADGSFSDNAQIVWSPALSAKANLGEDLRDDHPVDFQYPTSGTAGLEDIKLPTGGAVVGNITSISYKLFSEAGVLTMQCATCHDVHNGGQGTSPKVQFMRGATASVDPISGSQICRDCHTAK